MRRQKESFGLFLLKSPWWVSVTLGLVIFVVMRWVIPSQVYNNPALKPFAIASIRLSPSPLLLFGLFAVASIFFNTKRRSLVDQQTSLKSLRNTPWKDFEYLVAEAFQRQGYQVEYSVCRGADGGVDLILRQAGRTSLVQCKQWKVFSVGAPVIREMFGLMTAERADEVIIVTSGKFTRDAQDFARGKPIRLIDGSQLLVLVQSVQARPTEAPVKPDNKPSANEPPACPSCGKPMLLRISRRGNNAGNQFWGCSTYPSCKGTRNVLA